MRPAVPHKTRARRLILSRAAASWSRRTCPSASATYTYAGSPTSAPLTGFGPLHPPAASSRYGGIPCCTRRNGCRPTRRALPIAGGASTLLLSLPPPPPPLPPSLPSSLARSLAPLSLSLTLVPFRPCRRGAPRKTGRGIYGGGGRCFRRERVRRRFCCRRLPRPSVPRI